MLVGFVSKRLLFLDFGAILGDDVIQQENPIFSNLEVA